MRVPARRKGSHCDADIPGRRPGNVPANCTATIVLKCAVASEKSNHVRTQRALNVRRNYSFQGAMQVCELDRHSVKGPGADATYHVPSAAAPVSSCHSNVNL